MAINITVSLGDIVEKLEEANEFSDEYLNISTGEFAVVFEENIVDRNEELVDEIEESKDYIKLPNQYDIHEYRIMEGFAEIIRCVKNLAARASICR